MLVQSMWCKSATRAMPLALFLPALEACHAALAHSNKKKSVFKRVMGLSKDHSNTDYSTSLFDDPSEHKLHEQLQKAQQKAQQASNHNGALQALIEIKPALESFFDSVMVMAKEDSIRLNRLSLLRNIAQSFYKIADFSLLSTD